MPREWEANVGTTDKAVDLLWHGLAANTHQVYRAGQATYARFASSQGFKPFPSNLKHSLKSLPLPPKKRRRRPVLGIVRDCPTSRHGSGTDFGVTVVFGLQSDV